MFISIFGGNFSDNLRSVCLKSTRFTDRLDLLKELTKNRPNVQHVHHSQHSIGFHLDHKKCKQVLKISGRELIDISVTAFLSEYEKYLFLFVDVSVKHSNHSNSGLNSTQALFRMDFGSIDYSLGVNIGQMLVFWMKKTEIKNNEYIIEYNKNFKQRIQTHGFADDMIEEQLLITDFDGSEDILVSATQAMSVGDITLNGSYLIVCGQLNGKSYTFDKCKPIQSDEYINCECSGRLDEYMGDMYVIVIFWGVVLILAMRPLMEIVREEGKRGNKVYYQFVNCNERNGEHRYALVFRFAKGTIDFDLKDIVIDVEFFGESNESVAPQMRFKADFLETKTVVDIQITQIRMTKLPKLTRVVCSHNGDMESKILLMGVLVKGIHNDRERLDWFPIRKNIIRNSRQFNLRAKDPETDTKVETPLRHISINQISLSFLELLWIVFLDISFIASLVVFMPLPLRQSYSITEEMAVTVGIITPVAIVFHTLVVVLYKYILVLQMRQQLALSATAENNIQRAILVLYITSTALAMISGMAVVYRHKHNTFLETYQWLSCDLCITGILVLVYSVVSTPMECKYSTADTICLNHLRTAFSSNPSPFSSKPIKSPPSAKSVTINTYLFLHSNTLCVFMINSWRIIFTICTSRGMYLSFILTSNRSRSIIFTATNCVPSFRSSKSRTDRRRSRTKAKPEKRSPTTTGTKRSTVKVIDKSLSKMTEDEIGCVQLAPGVDPIVHLKSQGYDLTSNEIGKGGYGKVYMAYTKLPQETAPTDKPSLTSEKPSEKAVTDATPAETPAVSPPKQVNTLVACKVIEIKEDSPRKTSLKKQMLHELYSQRALSHEFVVQTYAAFVLSFAEQPGGPLQTNAYIFMEYSKDGDLEAELKGNKGPLDEPTAKHYFGQIVSGMRYIHKNGKVHRDLKLANVLVFPARGQSGKVCKLTDFGLLDTAYKDETGYERDTRMVGTRDYWCPEILNNVLSTAKGEPLKKYDKLAADCWALGVIAYRLLTNKFPFQVPMNPKSPHRAAIPSNQEYISELTEVITKMTKKDIPFPKSIPIGSHSWDIITRCLDPRPNHRVRIDNIIASQWLYGETSLTPLRLLKK
ncbi:unnamed protein product [Medioppia subpectinata]|uniref:Protein kinase domain-containing protein n=1 Tax=Medioppia subpectinata TaxID=1979941 RepID=A0A7R9L1F5_9ACAR|nr:unnamed protein product [Medioppia subpectinata]CAG2112600.1 unnamed protein product [Medioppia subpectinata]